jgi:hypothetical protein
MHLLLVLSITAFVGMGSKTLSRQGVRNREAAQSCKAGLDDVEDSAAVLVGASATDVASSWGKCCDSPSIGVDRRTAVFAVSDCRKES